VSARTRITLTVALLALTVGAAVAGITAATSSDSSGARVEGPKARPGLPPLSLDLGVRVDREALDLRQAVGLYEAGKRADAEKLFGAADWSGVAKRMDYKFPAGHVRIADDFLLKTWGTDYIARTKSLGGDPKREAKLTYRLERMQD